MQCFSTETVGQIYIFPSSVHDSKMGKQGRPQMVRIFSAERVFDIHSWCYCMSRASFLRNLQRATILCMHVVVSKGLFFQVWGHASHLERRLACAVKVGGSPAVSGGRVQVTSESSWLHQQVCYSGPWWGSWAWRWGLWLASQFSIQSTPVIIGLPTVLEQLRSRAILEDLWTTSQMWGHWGMVVWVFGVNTCHVYWLHGDIQGKTLRKTSWDLRVICLEKIAHFCHVCAIKTLNSTSG